MSVTTNASQFAARMNKAAAAIPAANQAGVKAAGDAIKKSILATARSRGWKADDRWVQTSSRGGRNNPQTLVELRGARAYWAQRGTKTHDVHPKNRRAILTPQGPRANARVRGMRGRPFFYEGASAGRPAAVAASEKAVAGALRAGFGA